MSYLQKILGGFLSTCFRSHFCLLQAHFNGSSPAVSLSYHGAYLNSRGASPMLCLDCWSNPAQSTFDVLLPRSGTHSRNTSLGGSTPGSGPPRTPSRPCSNPRRTLFLSLLHSMKPRGPVGATEHVWSHLGILAIMCSIQYVSASGP